MKRKDLITALILSLPLTLTLLLVILKLTSVLSWTWWSVTSPLWGTLSVFILLALLYVGVLYYKVSKL